MQLWFRRKKIEVIQPAADRPEEVALTGVTELRVYPELDESDIALSWLRQVDVEFLPRRDMVMIRVMTSQGFVEMAVRMVGVGTGDVAPWCATCRRALVYDTSRGQWFHVSASGWCQYPEPAPLRGRLVALVPHPGMSLPRFTRTTLRGEATHPAAVAETSPGVLVFGGV